ncbi:response regulator [Pseudooceanicola aestuarii]|uniref:hybrid sensor histidine kinase/response regulator n=1 Tax=Pseudooceanicola aestuarii TaxID=2697319 RepID=UPI0013CF4624|nr:response regulator [Pseudooceanicola aestuarii]
MPARSVASAICLLWFCAAGGWFGAGRALPLIPAEAPALTLILAAGLSLGWRGGLWSRLPRLVQILIAGAAGTAALLGAGLQSPLPLMPLAALTLALAAEGARTIAASLPGRARRPVSGLAPAAEMAAQLAVLLTLARWIDAPLPGSPGGVARAVVLIGLAQLLLRLGLRAQTATLPRPGWLLAIAVLAILAVTLLSGGWPNFPGALLLPLAGGLILLGLGLRGAWPAATALAGIAGLSPALAGAVPVLPPGPTLLLAGIAIVLILLEDQARTGADIYRDAARLAHLRDRLDDLDTGSDGAALTGGRLVHVDVAQRRVCLPAGGRQVSFAQLFAETPSAQLLDLLDRLHGDAADPAPDAPLELPLRGGLLSGAQDAPATPHRLIILERSSQGAWIGLQQIAELAVQKSRADRLETLLTGTLLREERLLSVASHELRTPASVLDMLAEELEDGTPWSDVADTFGQSLRRILSILDDLRLQGGPQEMQGGQPDFTLRELALHLDDTFRAAARANGITLRLSLSPRTDTLIRSDYARAYVALSKLLHNAIVHSKATEVVLSAFLTRSSGTACSVTWELRDNGTGIPADRAPGLFAPFDTLGTGRGTEQPGLGLFTARKALRMMGGDVVLKTASAPSEQGGGCTFVATHPAQLAQAEKYRTYPQEDPMDGHSKPYPDRTILLVEDNQIVGEITATRLNRLVGKTVWATSGTEALEAWRADPPDLILVDQLLPGLLGSELITRIRAADGEVPIVGVTASAMGTECLQLERAGANYAVEKPLSFVQLKKITSEFFPDPE